MSARFKLADESSKAPLVACFPTGLPAGFDESSELKVYGHGDARKKRRRVLVAKKSLVDPQGASHTLTYEAKSVHGNDPLFTTMVGIYDKKTKQVELHPIETVYKLKQWTAPTEQVPENRTDGVDYMQQRRDLVSTFGSKKKQTQLRARDANKIKVENVSGASAVQKLLEVRAEAKRDLIAEGGSSSSFKLGGSNKLESAAIDKAMDENRKMILPPYDEDATSSDAVYDVTQMVQANETKALEEARAALLVSIEEDESEDFWKTYRGPRFVQAQARRMCQDPEAAAENTDILYLLYLRHMIRMYNTRFPIMNKTKAQIGSMLDGASDGTVMQLLKNYAEKIHGAGNQGGPQDPESLR
jgi:hypothetical protein